MFLFNYLATVKRRFNKPAAAIRARMAQKCKDERRFGRSPVPPTSENMNVGMITGESPVAAITTKHNPRKVRKRPYSERSPGKCVSDAKHSSRGSNSTNQDFSNLNQFGGGAFEDGTSSSATDSNQLPPLNMSPLGTGSGLGCSNDLYDVQNSFELNSNGPNGCASNNASNSYFYPYDSSVACLSPSMGASVTGVVGGGHSGVTSAVVPTPLIFNNQPSTNDNLIIYDTNSVNNSTSMMTNNAHLAANTVHMPIHDYHQPDHSLMTSTSTSSPFLLVQPPSSVWNNSMPVGPSMNTENHLTSYSLSCV